MKTDIAVLAAGMLLTFLLTVLISRKLIPLLKSRHLGQPILEIGPRWHKSKEGTPTMGGIAFITATIVSSVLLSVFFGVKYGGESIVPFVLTLAYAVLCGMTGLIDDLAKLKKKQNEGLSAKQKFALQVLFAALYLAAMCLLCDLGSELKIPFSGGFSLDVGIAFYVIAMLVLTGIDNSVNLTDGIDGLASSVTLIVSVFYGAYALLKLPAGSPSLSMLAFVTVGATAGFLVYNFYPARVFMGDTGSLFLGALMAGGAFIMKDPLIILIAGLVYVIEAASVILQVGYFKLTHGKRLFKMAPIHHHFEKCGLNEISIVLLFSGAAAVFCAVAWFAL